MTAPLAVAGGFVVSSRPGSGLVGITSDYPDHYLTTGETEALIAALQVKLAAARGRPGGTS